MKYRKLVSFLCVGALLAGMLVMPAGALSSEEILSQIEELESANEEIRSQLAELEQQTQENFSEMEEVVRQKGNIDHQIALLNAQIQVTEAQIQAYSDLIADKQAELDRAQIRFDELSEKNKERIRAMEENGAVSYWSVLFKANSFADFLDRLNMMEEIARADKQRLQDLDMAAKAVADAREQLVSQKAELEQAKASQDEAMFGFMQMIGGKGAKDSHFAEAQAIKDATMAWFIAQNFDRKFIHFNGNFHSDNKGGIIPFLEQYLPGKSIVTICSARQDSLNSLEKENRGRPDFINVAPTDFPMSY